MGQRRDVLTHGTALERPLSTSAHSTVVCGSFLLGRSRHPRLKLAASLTLHEPPSISVHLRSSDGVWPTVMWNTNEMMLLSANSISCYKVTLTSDEASTVPMSPETLSAVGVASIRSVRA